MINLTDYGFLPSMLSDENENNSAGIPVGIPARITAVHRERFAIICQHGEAFARVKASVYLNNGFEEFPTAGDFVTISYNPSGDSMILSTLPRKTFFSRRDPTPGRGEQAVAANFDYVFIMQSLNHDLNGKRLERYLTLAWQSGAVPVVILTKSDLVEDYMVQLRETERIAAGVGVYAVSSKTGAGIDALKDYIKPRKTIVFLGSSGIGKSSLVNALAGGEVMNVNTIREDDSKGRHTTTHRQLIMLENGTMIIDTPGMRELGMWDVSEGLGQAFDDVEQYMGRCKFSDCQHTTEPGCAIKAAIAEGELSEERWESYNKLKNEAKYSDDKSEFLRRKQQWCKDVAKYSKQLKKDRTIR